MNCGDIRNIIFYALSLKSAHSEQTALLHSLLAPLWHILLLFSLKMLKNRTRLTLQVHVPSTISSKSENPVS